MKTAKTITLVAIVFCPDCDGPIADPNGTGSYDWTSDSSSPKTVKCDDCGKTFKMPVIRFS